MSRWWHTFGPHRAVGMWKLRGNMWQVIGGRYWSLVLFRDLHIEDQGGLVPAGDCPSPVADSGDQATTDPIGADSPVESQTP